MSPPLYPHQRDAIDAALRRRGSLALFHEPGLGKTRTCLDIFTRLRAETPALRCLVVCPLSLVEPVWMVETPRWTPFRATTLKRLDPTADIWITNYEWLIRSAAQRVLMPHLNAPWLLVIDESSRLKDPRSLTTKTCLALAERCRHRLVCSGTPAPNLLTELWAQLKVVDPESVHRSFFSWRREYFHLSRNGRVTDPPNSPHAMRDLFRHGWEWAITAANRDRLLARAAPICSWLRKEDALTLPEKIFTTRHVTLSAEEHRAYEQMRRQLIVEFETEDVTAPLALTKLVKLRQLASGFLYGETEHVLGASRLTVLLDTLEELGPQPVVIWAQFQYEIRQIAAALGEKAVTMYGETKNPAESLRRFGTEAQYLIAHPRSAGHGLTLTQASTAVWYSLDWSLESYSQANDRIHRIGQSRSCLYVHLVSPGTIDEQILEVLHGKQELQAAIDRVLGKRSARLQGSDTPRPLPRRLEAAGGLPVESASVGCVPLSTQCSRPVRDEA